MKRAIFLDKDGTLIENVPYNVAPEHIMLTPGAGEGVRRLSEAGYGIFIISNQSGVARGYFPAIALAGVEEYLRDLLGWMGVRLDGFYFCPHHPAGLVPEYTRECMCRKPAEGLLLQAAREHGIDLAHSWMIGDTLNDVEAGRRAGCRTILLDNGGEVEWRLSPARLPHHVVSDLRQAARVAIALDPPAAPD